MLEGIPGLSRKHCFILSPRRWSENLVHVIIVFFSYIFYIILRCPNSEAPSPLNQRKAPAMCRSHWGQSASNGSQWQSAFNDTSSSLLQLVVVLAAEDVSTNGTYLNGKRLPRPPFKNPADSVCRVLWKGCVTFSAKE